MAIPSYSTDLTIVASGEAAETWSELTGATAGGAPDEGDTETRIQGAAAVSQTCSIAGWKSMAFVLGAPRVIAPGDASFHWQYFGAPLALNTYASCGMGIAIGNLIGAWKLWKVLGSDTYAYGGWINTAVDPTCAADGQYGSPTSDTTVFGSVINPAVTIAKGQPHAADCIRTGRSLICIGGDATNGYGTFPGAAAQNDLSDNRWGLCQAVQGGYLLKGRFQIGTATVCADFRDANRSILLQDLPRVSPEFTRFEINHADTRVDWNSISFLSLGTNARGTIMVSGNADVNIDGCVFTDMGTLSFQSNSTINDSTFRRCATIYQSGGLFDGCLFDSGRDSRTIISTTPNLISNSSFISDGSNHAIEIATLGASAAFVVTNLTYTGYAAASGSTGNECIYNNSGTHVKLTIDGGTSPSYRNGTSATTEIVIGQRTLTLTGLVSGSEVRIYDQAGPPPNELTGIESSETTFQYSYTYAASTYVDIVVHKEDKLYYRIENYLLLDSNASLPISQQLDRQYYNPI